MIQTGLMRIKEQKATREFTRTHTKTQIELNMQIYLAKFTNRIENTLGAACEWAR